MHDVEALPTVRRSKHGTLGCVLRIFAAIRSAIVPYRPPATVTTGAGLAAWLATVPDGGTIELPSNARYPVAGTIELVARVGLTINAQGAVLTAAPSTDKNRAVLRLTGGKNLTIRGLHIDGGYTDAPPQVPGPVADGHYNELLEGQHGIAALGVQGLVLEDCSTVRTAGDGLYLYRLKLAGKSPLRDGAAAYQWCSNVRVTRGSYTQTGRQGMSVLAAGWVLVEDALIGWSARSNVDIEPNATAFTGATMVWFRRCHFAPSRLNTVAAAGTGPVSELHLEDCTSDDPLDVVFGSDDPTERRSGLYMLRCSSPAPAGNDVGAVVRVKHTDVVVLVANGQPAAWREGGRRMSFAALDDCTGVDVHGNLLGQFGGTQVLGVPD